MNPDRRTQIVRLLTTRDEHLPSLRPGEVPPAGFVSGVRVRSCPDCLANGRRLRGCETCGGKGVVEASRMVRIALTDSWRGQSSRVDPYAVLAVVPFGADPLRHERARERDAEINRIGRQVRPPSAVDEDEDAERSPFEWERARAVAWARFDYAALDRALDELREWMPGTCRLLHAVFVYGWLEEVADEKAERALELLSELLPDPLRAPPAEGPGLRELVGRDAAIRRMVALGASSKAAAEEFGLSVSQVNRIVAASGGA